MTKYAIRTEALHIIASLSNSCDMSLLYDDEEIKDQEKRLEKLVILGWELDDLVVV